MNRTRIILWSAVALVVLFLMPIVFHFSFYREFAFICENTGSRKGHRVYCTGFRTRDWYKLSAVETFIKQQYPNELQHRWTSYAGTGKNIFGQSVLFGHGRPGPIRDLRLEELNEWYEGVPDTEKKVFYDLLLSGDESRIKTRIAGVWEEILDDMAAPSVSPAP